jgi:hypothetical protein
MTGKLTGRLKVTPQDIAKMLTDGTIELYIEDGIERYRLTEKGYAVVQKAQAEKKGRVS